MNRLAGKVAVVLGAAGKDNMGQVIARRFAQEGARVVAGGRVEEPLREFAAEIQGRYSICDITRKSDVEQLSKVALDAYGRVDIAVNCTGWGLMARLRDTTEEQIDRLMDLQFKGTFFFLQVFAEQLAAGKGGSIITISSASVLASDESFVTGQVMQVNGGLTLRRNPLPREINASLAAASAPAGSGPRRSREKNSQA